MSWENPEVLWPQAHVDSVISVMSSVGTSSSLLLSISSLYSTYTGFMLRVAVPLSGQDGHGHTSLAVPGPYDLGSANKSSREAVIGLV